jgi:hypothetical protein
MIKIMFLKAIYWVLPFLLISCSTVNIEKQTQGIDGLSDDVQKSLYMPSGTEVLMNESVVIGKDDNWVGKLTLLNDSEVKDTYAFIRKKYTENQWVLKTTYQSENAFLVFEKENKLITIDISPNGLMGKNTKILFTFSEI